MLRGIGWRVAILQCQTILVAPYTPRLCFANKEVFCCRVTTYLRSECWLEIKNIDTDRVLLLHVKTIIGNQRTVLQTSCY